MNMWLVVQSAAHWNSTVCPWVFCVIRSGANISDHECKCLANLAVTCDISENITRGWMWIKKERTTLSKSSWKTRIRLPLLEKWWSGDGTFSACRNVFFFKFTASAGFLYFFGGGGGMLYYRNLYLDKAWTGFKPSFISVSQSLCFTVKVILRGYIKSIRHI